MTKPSLKKVDWSNLFEKFIEYSPTAEALSKVGQSKSLSQALDKSLSKLLELTVDQKQEEYALYKSLEIASRSPQLSSALQGDRSSQELLLAQLIKNYLTVLPWGELSELELAQLWLKWSSTLSEGLSIHDEELWVTIPSVKLKHWIDLEFTDVLEDAFELYRNSTVEQAKVALAVKGLGKSATLAYMRRWLLSKGESCSFYSQFTELGVFHKSESMSQILIVDDLTYQGRLARWRVAECLTQYPNQAVLLIWSESETHKLSSSFSSQLKASFDHYLELDLDLLWQSQKLDFEDHFSTFPNWLSTRRTELLETDYLRCLMGTNKPPKSEPLFQISDLDAFAALIGPLAPISVLALATQQSEENLTTMLKASAWLEVGDCPKGTGLYAPPSIEFWRAALIEGGRRSHQSAHRLQEAIEEIYTPHQRLFMFNALQRLSRLRGRADYLGSAEPYCDLKQALVSLRRLQKSLALEKPHPLTLNTLCGLGFDWASRGPVEGYWNETLHALQVAAASAERLREPQLAGRLLHSLGSIALQDGRAEIAEYALQASLQLLHATRVAKEASESALLLAESKLLSSSLANALKALEKAETIAKGLASPQAAWRARFRAGQLYAMSGQSTLALKFWESLMPTTKASADKSSSAKNSEGQPKKALEKSAFGALVIELAGQKLKVGQIEQAQADLKQLDEASLSRSILSMISELYVYSSSQPNSDLEEQLALLQEDLSQALVQNQKKREIGSWLVWQNWRCEIYLQVKKLVEEKKDLLKSIPPLFSAQEARLGLELSLKVAVGTRDRLNIMSIYRQLSALYFSLNELEASLASWAMAEAWAKTLDLNIRGSFGDQDQELMKTHQTLPSDLINTTHRDAEQEVTRLVNYWSKTPLSMSLNPTSE